MSLISELRRRNVLQVGVAYVVMSWLLLQVADILLPAFAAPEWAMRGLVLALAVGLPIALVVAWIFDITPEGIRRTDELDADATAVPPMRGATLNYVIIGVLAAAVVLFSLDKFVFDAPPVAEDPATPERPSVAVLPFANLSGDEENDPFTHGLHDDLLTQLSKIGSIDVASRTSVLRYRDTVESLPDIARELGVTAVLEGSVQRSEDRVRLNAQLIDARTDTHLWAETIDRELNAANVFAIQSEVAKAIASALEATLSPGEIASLDTVPTASLEAYDAYSTGRLLLERRTPDRVERAVAAFEEATRLDSGFASAWAGLCQARLAQYTARSDTADFDRAERACTRALTLDPGRAETHVALGALYRAYGDYGLAEKSLKRAQFDKAERALRDALALDDLAVEAHVELGLVYARQGRTAKALDEIEQALALRPDSAAAYGALFSLYYSYADDADRFERAEAAARRATELDPDDARHWNNLGSARYMREDFAGAGEAWQHSLALQPTRTAYTNTGLALYFAGDFAGAAEMQRKATELAPEDHRSLGRLADALAMIDGREDEARATYGQAADRARAALAINDRDWQTWGMLATYLAHAGEAAPALDAASRAVAVSERRAEALYYAAQAHAVLGDAEAALALLAEVAEKDPAYRSLIASDAALRGLARDPRFDAIVTGKGP